MGRHLKLAGLALLAALCGSGAPAAASTLPPTDIRAYRGVCDGQTDVSAAVVAMLADYNVAVIPVTSAGCLVAPVSNNGLTIGNNQTVVGSSRGAVLKIGATQNQGIFLNGNDATVSNLTVQSNGGSQGILVAGSLTNPSVRNVTFTGCVTGFDLWWLGDSAGFGTVTTGGLSDGNFYDHANDSACAPTGNEIVEGMNGFVSNNEVLENYFDFGISFRWSQGQVNSYKSHSPTYQQSITATSSQTSFSFSGFPTRLYRFAVQVSGVPVASGWTITPNGAGTAFTAVGPAQTTGTVVTLIGWRSLESININSGSTVTVSGAYIDGTGDGGVVMGGDYHNNGTAWVLTPGTAIGDYPFLNGVYNTFITNVAASGISVDGGCPEVVIDGYNISNFSLGVNDPLFSSGIALATSIANSGLCYSRVGSGVIDNSSGRGQFGISAQQGLVETGLANKQLVIGDVTFRSSFASQLNFPVNPSLGAGAALPRSIDVTSRQAKPFPVQPDWNTSFSTKPANNSSWSYANSGSGWTQIAGLLGQDHAIQTIAGSVVDQTPLSESSGQGLTFGGLLRVKFWAKSTGAATSSNASFACVFAVDTAAQQDSVCIPITNTNLYQYTMDVPMMGGQLAQGLSIFRIGAPASGVTADFQYPELSVVDLN